MNTDNAKIYGLLHRENIKSIGLPIIGLGILVGTGAIRFGTPVWLSLVLGVITLAIACVNLYRIYNPIFEYHVDGCLTRESNFLELGDETGVDVLLRHGKPRVIKFQSEQIGRMEVHVAHSEEIVLEMIANVESQSSIKFNRVDLVD